MVAKPPRKPQRTSYTYHTHPMKVETTLCAYPAQPRKGPNNILYLFG